MYSEASYPTRQGTRPRDTMTVAELARAADVTPHVVRHYTRIGLLEPGRNQYNGYKLFTQEHLTRLLFIRRAKYLGFTLGDIRKILDKARAGDSPCPEVRDLIRRRIQGNRERLNALLALQERMERALESWSQMPDGQPDGHSICHLIESMSPETGGSP